MSNTPDDQSDITPALLDELAAANAEADNPATVWVSGEDLLRQLRERRQEKPVGLIDLDGSVADFDAAMAAKLESLRGPGEDPTLDETAYEDVPHIKARRRLIKSQPGFWRDLKPLQSIRVAHDHALQVASRS